MKYRALTAAVGLLTAALAATPTMAQRAPLGASEVAKIQADVKAAAENYVKIFGQRDLRTIVDKVWAHPAVEITPNGVKLLTPADVEANYTKMFADLAKTQYDHSDTKLSVCVLTPAMAVASGPFKRINKDGSVLLEGSMSYLFTKMSDGWRITTNLGVQPNKIVNCN